MMFEGAIEREEIPPATRDGEGGTPLDGRPGEGERALRLELERALRRADQLGKDLQNYRRNAEARLSREQAHAREALLAELGDVLRSLELAADAPADDPATIREGVALVLRGLESIYERQGLQRIPTSGEAFDPSLHEALYTEPAGGRPRGTVVRELSPGFRAGERVIRPARVSVAA